VLAFQPNRFFSSFLLYFTVIAYIFYFYVFYGSVFQLGQQKLLPTVPTNKWNFLHLQNFSQTIVFKNYRKKLLVRYVEGF